MRRLIRVVVIGLLVAVTTGLVVALAQHATAPITGRWVWTGSGGHSVRLFVSTLIPYGISYVLSTALAWGVAGGLVAGCAGGTAAGAVWLLGGWIAAVGAVTHSGILDPKGGLATLLVFVVIHALS
ncbi:MAG: hypothetical protein HYV62_13060, partial [Candidatus Rokubacteria bacterium]|nr:hypothetical protein [Candidatus Rokubacteria bacterium]